MSQVPLPSIIALKAYLSSLIVETLHKRDLTQREGAVILGISQPRISEIKNAKLHKFTVDTLMEYCMKLDIDFNFNFDPNNDKKLLKMTAVRCE